MCPAPSHPVRRATRRLGALTATLAASGLALLALTGSSSPPPSGTYTATYLEWSEGWGSAIADYDNDGLQDLFVTGHDANDRIWFDGPSGFQPGPLLRTDFVDRHDCDAADIDGDGWVDMYCEIGAEKGTGIKANEVWINNHDRTFRLVTGHGAEDPSGRGRIARFFDLDHDGRPDIYDTVQATDRPDGLPNFNHVYLNDGNVHFHEVVTIATGNLGYICAAKGDIDGDGWDDLVVCPDTGPGHLFVNNHQLDFTALVTPAIGPQWRDAKLVDVNGDGRDDLVVVTSANVLQVWLNSGRAPWFPTRSFRTQLPFRSDSIAIGDFNHDGFKDIYVVMRDYACNNTQHDAAPDMVLWGNGTGKAWRAETLVQDFAGCGHLADVIDGDEVLLENGSPSAKGPQYVLSWR